MFANTMYSTPTLARLAFRVLASNLHRLPVAGHLKNLDGSPYMWRWWVVSPGTFASRALKWISCGRYESIRLHWIRSHDVDRELHSHPFDYTSVILRGYYVEEKLDFWPVPPLSQRHTSYRIVRAGNIANMVASFHRIAQVSPGGVWTLFLMGKNNGNWGFLTEDGVFLDRKTYFRMKGYRKASHTVDKPRDFQP